MPKSVEEIAALITQINIIKHIVSHPNSGHKEILQNHLCLTQRRSDAVPVCSVCCCRFDWNDKVKVRFIIPPGLYGLQPVVTHNKDTAVNSIRC